MSKPSKAGQYSKSIWVRVTPKMHQYVKLMADRNDTSMNDVIRQAIREHLDLQEDLITSRSRLGRTVMRRLDEMHKQIFDRITYPIKLMLSAIIIQMADQGSNAGDATNRIIDLANQPAMDRVLRSKKSK